MEDRTVNRGVVKQGQKKGKRKEGRKGISLRENRVN